LKELSINSCIWPELFLNSLSALYAKKSGVLEELHVGPFAPVGEDQQSLDAVERFLKICPKLTEIVLDFGLLIQKECVLAHADTVCSLMVADRSSGPFSSTHLSVQDVESILKACTKLEQIAIDFPVFNLGYVTEAGTWWRLNRLDAESTVMTEYESMLVSCSRDPH
jgi:hypothetical protein